MFQDLYQLFNSHRNSNRTPLEDFNTEAFANILKLYPSILNEYVIKFLKLPEGDYKATTQVHKQLPEDNNCIVDLVFESDEVICFVENKVESSEGYHQLERYGKALQLYYPDKIKHLHYCTKYSDPKKGEYSGVDYFKQYRWYEIANYLKPFATEYPLIKDYIAFLKQHKMEQDNTIKIENLLAVENLWKSVDIFQFYINNSLFEFTELFGNKKSDKSSHWAQIREHNRIAELSERPLICDDNSWSEILYSVEFDTLQLNVQIFLNKDHSQLQRVKDCANKLDGFIIEEYEYGVLICKTIDLGIFLNDKEADKKIKSWFKESFGLIQKFIQSTSTTLDWKTELIDFKKMS